MCVTGEEDVRKNNLLNVLQRSVTLTTTSKVVSHSEEVSKEDESCGQSLKQALVAAARSESCSVCGSINDTSARASDRSEDDDDKCLTAKEIVSEKGSTAKLARKQAEAIPGWPLLRRAFTSAAQPVTSHRPLKLPPKSNKQIGYDSITTKKSSPDNSPRKPPKELEGLYERFSSACQVFKYKELVSVTSDFSTGLFFLPLTI